MPLFVLDTMGRTPGLTGLFLAGVCSSALCSVSAALNSLAVVTLEDYITVNFPFPFPIAYDDDVSGAVVKSERGGVRFQARDFGGLIQNRSAFVSKMFFRLIVQINNLCDVNQSLEYESFSFEFSFHIGVETGSNYF